MNIIKPWMYVFFGKYTIGLNWIELIFLIIYGFYSNIILLYAELFWGYLKTYLYFHSFLDTEMTQMVEINRQASQRHGQVDSTLSVLSTICADNWAHDDVIKRKHFPRYWPFVQGIHQSPVNSQHKGQWRRALMFSLICVWINGWVNKREAGDWRCYCAHYDVIVMNTRGHGIIIHGIDLDILEYFNLSSRSVQL